MMQLRNKAVAKGHTARKCQSQDINSGNGSTAYTFYYTKVAI